MLLFFIFVFFGFVNFKGLRMKKMVGTSLSDLTASFSSVSMLSNGFFPRGKLYSLMLNFAACAAEEDGLVSNSGFVFRPFLMDRGTVLLLSIQLAAPDDFSDDVSCSFLPLEIAWTVSQLIRMLTWCCWREGQCLLSWFRCSLFVCV